MPVRRSAIRRIGTPTSWDGRNVIADEIRRGEPMRRLHDGRLASAPGIDKPAISALRKESVVHSVQQPPNPLHVYALEPHHAPKAIDEGLGQALGVGWFAVESEREDGRVGRQTRIEEAHASAKCVEDGGRDEAGIESRRRFPAERDRVRGLGDTERASHSWRRLLNPGLAAPDDDGCEPDVGLARGPGRFHHHDGARRQGQTAGVHKQDSPASTPSNPNKIERSGLVHRQSQSRPDPAGRGSPIM